MRVCTAREAGSSVVAPRQTIRGTDKYTARHCAGGSVSGPKRKPAPGSYSGGWFFSLARVSQRTLHPSLPTRPALAPCGEAVGRACSNWPFQAAPVHRNERGEMKGGHRFNRPGWLLHRNMPVQNRDASTMRCASPPTADRRPPAPGVATTSTCNSARGPTLRTPGALPTV